VLEDETREDNIDCGEEEIVGLDDCTELLDSNIIELETSEEDDVE
jgi:hypothetical protein